MKQDYFTLFQQELFKLTQLSALSQFPSHCPIDFFISWSPQTFLCSLFSTFSKILFSPLCSSKPSSLGKCHMPWLKLAAGQGAQGGCFVISPSRGWGGNSFSPMLDLHYDRLVSDGISGWDLWLLANGWWDAVASAPLQPQQGKRKDLKWEKAGGEWLWLGNGKRMGIKTRENGC